MIKQADIVLYNQDHSWFGSLVFSWAVKEITDSQYTHGGVIVSFSENNLHSSVWVAEALAEGVVIRMYNKRSFNRMIENDEVEIYRHEGVENYTPIVREAMKMNGRPYGYKDLFKILIYALTGFSIYKSSVKQMTCFEAVERIYRNVGYRISDKDDPDLVFAKDIRESSKTSLITE